MAALTLRGARRAAAQQPGQGPQAAATLFRVAEDTFIWQNAGYNSLIVVTDEGVIATDPSGQFNPRGPVLYRNVIRSLTDQPVRYLVYSHDHDDHSTGGDVFADTAEFVGHRLAAPKIAARNEPRNPPPTILVDDAMTLDLGGKQVQLTYVGRNHSDNMLVIGVPSRRLVYTVDFIGVKTVQFRNLPDAYPDEWVESFRRVEAMDFDLLVPGHPGGGQFGARDTVRENREYMTDLMASVQAARERGLADNSPEMVASVRADLEPAYGTWANFGLWLSENIQGLIAAGFST